MLGEPERFPVKPPKKTKPLRRGTAWWIERDSAVWLVKRARKGMLGGMRALPDDGWSARSDGFAEREVLSLGLVRHGFSHFNLELSVVRGIEPLDSGEWWPLERLSEAGLPTLFAKAARLAIAQRADAA